MLFVRAPQDLKSVNVGGVNVEMRNGVACVDPVIAAQLKESFGFTDCERIPEWDPPAPVAAVSDPGNEQKSDAVTAQDGDNAEPQQDAEPQAQPVSEPAAAGSEAEAENTGNAQPVPEQAEPQP